MSSQDLDTRMRSVEQLVARIEERIKPFEKLESAMTTLTSALQETRREFSALKGQAVLLGALATIVSPCLFAIATWLVGHFFK